LSEPDQIIAAPSFPGQFADPFVEQSVQGDGRSEFGAGAQIITTDYYYKSAFFSSDYTIQFDDGKYFRKDVF